MELNKDTKLKDILAEYPDLKARLPEINPRFQMITTPMGKVMINKVTLGDMSQRSGTPLPELIAGIEKRITE